MLKAPWLEGRWRRHELEKQRGARCSMAMEPCQVPSPGDGLTGVTDVLEHLQFFTACFTSFIG